MSDILIPVISMWKIGNIEIKGKTLQDILNDYLIVPKLYLNDFDVNKIKDFFKRQKSYMQQRKTHHIYKCPQCKQKIRIPRGKGRVAIRCKRCGTEFIKNSR